MTNTINSASAMRIAIEYANLCFEETSDRVITLNDGLYEISFRAMFLAYEAYVDAQNGEVLGFSFEPVMPEEKHDRIINIAENIA